jgi:hypothetical protein
MRPLGYGGLTTQKKKLKEKANARTELRKAQ